MELDGSRYCVAYFWPFFVLLKVPKCIYVIKKRIIIDEWGNQMSSFRQWVYMFCIFITRKIYLLFQVDLNETFLFSGMYAKQAKQA